MNVWLAWLLLVLTILVYLAPIIVAVARQHHQIGPIAIVTLFLGWTFIGWIVALAWSLSAVKKGP